MAIAIAAQDLADTQAVALDSARHALAVADSLIHAQVDEIIVVRLDRGAANHEAELQTALTQIQRKKKRRWIGITVGVVVIWVGNEYVEYKQGAR